MVSARRKGAKAASSSNGSARKAAKSSMRSNRGAILTTPSDRPARYARALDHGQSPTSAASRARTGFIATAGGDSGGRHSGLPRTDAFRPSQPTRSGFATDVRSNGCGR